MKMMKKMVIASAVCAMSVSMAQAGVVSFNVDNNGTISSSDTLGAVEVSNWHNTWNGSGQDWWLENLEDSDGNVTDLDIGWNGGSGDWSCGGSKDNANATMQNGYINGNGANGAYVYVQDMNPSYTYTVYVYFNSDNDTRVGTISDGDDEIYYFGYDTGAASDGVLVQAMATDNRGFAIDANYAVFTVTGSDTWNFYSSAYSADGVSADYGGITAIQVVEVIPEPATIGLIGIAGAALVFVRRRLSM